MIQPSKMLLIRSNYLFYSNSNDFFLCWYEQKHLKQADGKERSGCSFKQAVTSLCALAVWEGPGPAWIFLKIRLECGETWGVVGIFGDFLKLLCCMYHAVSQQHSRGRRDRRGEVFKIMVFVCKVPRLPPLQARKKDAGWEFQPGSLL